MLIAAGGVFLFSGTVTVLSVRNLDRGNAWHARVSPSEQVTLFYTNSMYGAPVEEVFEIESGELVLTEVRTESPAVLEYYGFQSTYPVHPLRKSLGPAFSIQASMSQEQILKIGRSRLDLLSLARGGERVMVKIEQVSPATFLWCSLR